MFSLQKTNGGKCFVVKKKYVLNDLHVEQKWTGYWFTSLIVRQAKIPKNSCFFICLVSLLVFLGSDKNGCPLHTVAREASDRIKDEKYNLFKSVELCCLSS